MGEQSFCLIIIGEGDVVVGKRADESLVLCKDLFLKIFLIATLAEFVLPLKTLRVQITNERLVNAALICLFYKNLFPFE